MIPIIGILLQLRVAHKHDSNNEIFEGLLRFSYFAYICMAAFLALQIGQTVPLANFIVLFASAATNDRSIPVRNISEHYMTAIHWNFFMSACVGYAAMHYNIPMLVGYPLVSTEIIKHFYLN